MKRWMFGWWLALAGGVAHAAGFSIVIYPAGTDLAQLRAGQPVCLAGAAMSWKQQAGPVPNARAGALVLVRGGADPRLDGVYRIVAVAQSVNDGRVETLFHATCTTALS